MRTLRFYVYMLFIALVAVVTLGQYRLDRPRMPRIRTMGWLHRFVVLMISRWHARRDGRLYIPEQDDTDPPAEIEKLKQHAEGTLRRIASDWARGEERLKGEYDAIGRRLEACHDELENHLGPDLEDARERTRAIQARLDTAHSSEEDRAPEERWRIRRTYYWLGLLAIFIGELPLNGIAFRIFGEGTTETWIMTAGLAAVLIFCAHGLGVFARAEVLTRSERVLAWLLALLPVIAVVAIGIVREAHLETLAADENILRGLGAVGGTAIFVVINLIIYLGAVMLSYLHHDPVNHGIEKLQTALKKARRRERRAKRRQEAEKHRETWYETRQELWIGGIRGALREASFQARRHVDFFETFMRAYCSSNRVAVGRRMRREQGAVNREGLLAKRRRTDYVSPTLRTDSRSKALEHLPDIEIPTELREPPPLPDLPVAVSRNGGEEGDGQLTVADLQDEVTEQAKEQAELAKVKSGA